MAKVLYIKANPKTVERSLSLSLGEKFLETYQKLSPDDEITVIDLYQVDLPEIDFELLEVIETLMGGGSPENLPAETQDKLKKYNHFTDIFMQADKYIFVTPMWNLGFPPRVKAYIDAVCVAGKTFRYTEKGPVGLLENKKCLHLHASGGFHAEDPMNHADPYLKDIMSFMGVKDYKCIFVEGYMAVPDQLDEFIQKAHDQIPAVAEWFK